MRENNKKEKQTERLSSHLFFSYRILEFYFLLPLSVPVSVNNTVKAAPEAKFALNLATGGKVFVAESSFM